MKILPIAFESFGVRSMATYVETEDVKVLIDPGVALCPDRYSLPPHRLELERRREVLKALRQWAKVADIIIISHYHYDHHIPDEEELYTDKEIFLKHPREFINQSQKQRAAYFLQVIESCARNINIADNQHFLFGRTKIQFSNPVFHGLSARLGYVIEVFIEEEQRFLFSSDVQGPLNEDAVDFILECNPQIIILDGPATYLLGTHYKKSDIDHALGNIKKIIEKTAVKTLIIDHHLLRDINWQAYISKLPKIRPNLLICSAAGYLGKQEDILEARRKELYQAGNRG